MQIHEITKKTVNEDLVSGLTNMAWKAAGVANPLDQTGPQGTPVASNMRQAAAGEMNRSLLAPMAKQMQQRWAQTVQQLLTKSVDAVGNPATSAAQIKTDALEKELYLFINGLVGRGFDIGDLSTRQDPSGQSKELFNDIKPQITAAISTTQKPDSTQQQQIWLDLATSIQRAKSILNFSGQGNVKPATPGKDNAGKTTFNGAPYNKTDPSHRALIQMMGLNPDTYPK